MEVHKNQVKKIVIKSGITSICESAFTRLPAIEEVEVKRSNPDWGKSICIL